MWLWFLELWQPLCCCEAVRPGANQTWMRSREVSVPVNTAALNWTSQSFGFWGWSKICIVYFHLACSWEFPSTLAPEQAHTQPEKPGPWGRVDIGGRMDPSRAASQLSKAWILEGRASFPCWALQHSQLQHSLRKSQDMPWEHLYLYQQLAQHITPQSPTWSHETLWKWKKKCRGCLPHPSL